MFSVRSWLVLLALLWAITATGQDVSDFTNPGRAPAKETIAMSNRSTADTYGHRIEAGSEVKDISSGTEHGLEGIVTGVHPSGLKVTVEWEDGQTSSIDQRDIARQGF